MHFAERLWPNFHSRNITVRRRVIQAIQRSVQDERLSSHCKPFVVRKKVDINSVKKKEKNNTITWFARDSFNDRGGFGRILLKDTHRWPTKGLCICMRVRSRDEHVYCNTDIERAKLVRVKATFPFLRWNMHEKMHRNICAERCCTGSAELRRPGKYFMLSSGTLGRLAWS